MHIHATIDGTSIQMSTHTAILMRHTWMQISIKALYGYVNGDVSESIYSTSVFIIGKKFISIMHL